ncbi:MAG: phenylalanine--tRNA ligase subunit beta [Patescibacteria group bacterium]|jgi:phenylalanyl-tRNA synthetase beta chain
MKIQKSWLEKYVKEIGEMSADAVAELFRRGGIEVESIESGLDDNVVVAEILNVEKHPNADRLSLADVQDNTQTYKIVCGAPNIAKGMKVPLAKIGALLPGDFMIKKSTIRGVESEGMLCAADELGLGDDHSGIIVLPKEYELGEPLNKYLGNETIFDISITPNRGDLLSHIGSARELAAMIGKQIKKEPVSVAKTGSDIQSILALEVQDGSKCPQYFARVVQNVKVGPSPEWLKRKLELSGVRSINNVVDVTNFVLLDTGHPIHAFDLSKIGGKKIVVRGAKSNEKIVSLDGVERVLDSNDLVIADAKHPIAIAGIMGGKDSEVDDDTVNVVIEAAVFDPRTARLSSKTLKLQSEASYRFERGIDEGDTEYIINQAANMIAEVAGGNIANGILKSGQTPAKKIIKLNYEKINQILGMKLSDEIIRHHLKALDIELSTDEAIVPLWRHDLSIIEDVADEVGRVEGYDKIVPVYFDKANCPKFSQYFREESVKEALINNGFSETISYPYLSEKDVELLRLKKDKLLEVANPLQEELKYLRISLLPGLIKAVAKNPAFDPVLLFEIAHVYTKSKETTNLAIIASGKNAKPSIEKALSALKELLSKKFDAEITEFSRDELQKFKVKKPTVFVAEIDLSLVLEKSKIDEKKLDLPKSYSKSVYRPISKYPMITRDLAFLVDKKLDSSLITQSIYAVSDMINRVELFDEFASDKLGVGKKNVAYHLYLQDMDKTLTDQEAEQVVKKVVKMVENEYQAQLRTI